MSERIRFTLNESLLAGARKMNVQFPFLAQIKCRYEPAWNECLTLRVFPISGQNLLALGFLSGWLRLVVFFVEMGKGLEILQRPWRRKELFHSIYSGGNTDLIELHWKDHIIGYLQDWRLGVPQIRECICRVICSFQSATRESDLLSQMNDFFPVQFLLRVQSARPSVISSILEVRGNHFSTETCSTSFKASG